jgi:hypothetical protein
MRSSGKKIPEKTFPNKRGTICGVKQYWNRPPLFRSLDHPLNPKKEFEEL